MTDPRPPVRNCSALLDASQEVLRYLTAGGEPRVALRRSLQHLARGFGAETLSILLIEREDPIAVRVLYHDDLRSTDPRSGALVSVLDESVVAAAVASRNAQFESGVLSVPVHDATYGRSVAVICMHLSERPCQLLFPGGDASWLLEYAQSVGHAFAHYFDRARRDRSEDRPGSSLSEASGPELIGDSSQTHALREELHEVYIPASESRDPDPVLILGEKGTGKDLVARYLHAHSRRRERPLIVVNCAEITDELSASRFFGHRRGSFTGAVSDENGFFRAADKGVLFLDEIGELSLRAQATLLRVLENRTVVPVGDTREIAVDVQVVLATNRDPVRAVDEGVLKADFVDRFTTQSIHVAPLRQRVRDIPPLARHFQTLHEQRTGKRTPGFTVDALKAMLAYAWPGNVRELNRVCSLLLTHVRTGAPIDRELLVRRYPNAERPGNAAAALLMEDSPMRTAVRAFERELILARLEQHGWNARAARESLQLPKTTFQRLLTRAGVSRTISSSPD